MSSKIDFIKARISACVATGAEEKSIEIKILIAEWSKELVKMELRGYSEKPNKT